MEMVSMTTTWRWYPLHTCHDKKRNGFHVIIFNFLLNNVASIWDYYYY